MVMVKTSELTGAALDWAVGKVCGIDKSLFNGYGPYYGSYNPGSSWSQCGPLIEKYRIEFFVCHDAVHAKLQGKTNSAGYGDTHLIAACRAIVASQLGDEVDIPEVLI